MLTLEKAKQLANREVGTSSGLAEVINFSLGEDKLYSMFLGSFEVIIETNKEQYPGQILLKMLNRRTYAYLETFFDENTLAYFEEK